MENLLPWLLGIMLAVALTQRPIYNIGQNFYDIYRN
jgi:hypothetical protein